MAKQRNLNPERTSFLILLLIVTLTGLSIWTGWPKPAILEDARTEYSAPFDTNKLAEDYQVEFSGRDPLVPPAVEFYREYTIRKAPSTAKKPPVKTPIVVRPINPDISYVLLPSKNKPIATKPENPENNEIKEEKPFPVKIKGIAKFPDAGYRLVITDADGKYSRLAEGDEWEKDGETLQIRKIYPTKVIFLDNGGKVHTLEFDIMGMHLNSDESSQSTPSTTPDASTQASPPTGKRPATEKNVQKTPANKVKIPKIPGMSQQDIPKMLKEFMRNSTKK